jgi:DNA-binding response OmpR family regulator
LVSGYRRKVRSVLVVEDDACVRELAVEALRRAAFIVEEAANLQAARAIIAQGNVDLVLMDRELPDGDGFDLARELVAEDPKRPVIAFTANVDRAAREKAFTAGCAAFIAKPCSVDTFLAAIDGVLAVHARGGESGQSGRNKRRSL